MKIKPSIIENIAYHALSQPDKLCLADNEKAFTYREIWLRVYGLSQKLQSLGVRKGSCVVVECNQSVDYMISTLAIHLIGAVFVPLEKNAALSRVTIITKDTEAVLHIGKAPIEGLSSAQLNEELDSRVQETLNNRGNENLSSTQAGDNPATSIKFLELDSASNFADFSDPANADFSDLTNIDFPRSQDIAEILFSTGTTGKSKGIVLTHGNDIALAENVMYGVKMKKNNVEMVPMPLSHSHGLRRTYGNLVNGSSVVFVDGVTLLKKVFDLIEKYTVTSMDLSPSMLSIIFKLSKDRLGDYAEQMDYIQLGSAPLAEEDKLHLSRILPHTRLYNFYGSTEAGCSCLLDFNSMSGKPGCIGKPATNAHFIIVDENRNEIASSQENLGFLASSGSINMKCYFKAPELTAAAMENGFIYTKDMGYIDEDGYVYMLGRKDDVINYGGIKISPEEIESIVILNSQIEDCACIPVKDALTGQAPKLFIVPTDATKHDAKEFKNYLVKNLDANKQPKYIEIIDEIPRTFNGKIKRNILIERDK